jgi:hypothetical protein
MFWFFGELVAKRYNPARELAFDELQLPALVLSLSHNRQHLLWRHFRGLKLEHPRHVLNSQTPSLHVPTRLPRSPLRLNSLNLILQTRVLPLQVNKVNLGLFPRLLVPKVLSSYHSQLIADSYHFTFVLSCPLWAFLVF